MKKENVYLQLLLWVLPYKMEKDATYASLLSKRKRKEIFNQEK